MELMEPEAKHEISFEAFEDGFQLLCKCGELNSVATEERFIGPLSERHLLVQEEWPPNYPPLADRYTGWPHNTNDL